MVPSTFARQTGSPSTSTARRSPSSKSLSSAAFMKSVIRFPVPAVCREAHSGVLDADDGQNRAGDAVAVGRDEEERCLDDLIFAHPVLRQFFGVRFHCLKIRFGIDE